MRNHIWWKYGLSSRIVPDQLWPRQPRIIQPIYHLTILTDKLCTVCIAKAHLPKTRTLVGLQTTCWKRVFRDIVPREIRYCAEISFSSQTVTQMGGGLAQTPPIQISFIFFLDNLDSLKFLFFLVSIIWIIWRPKWGIVFQCNGFFGFNHWKNQHNTIPVSRSGYSQG